MSAFGEIVDLTANIKSIISRYPLSNGILQELLQNSEDAKGCKQIFVLDNRTHRPSVNDTATAHLRGPAIMAYNDSTFSDDDWTAVQRINQSSKLRDQRKIGKYGLGLRAGYHVTDNIQILSGDSLVIFDPHRTLYEHGGIKIDVVKDSEKYADILSPFDALDLPFSKPYPGTIIRLPLRTSTGSRITSEVHSVDTIRRLFLTFVEHELKIVMLFLSNIKSIELWEIDDTGRRCLGKAETSRSELTVISEPRFTGNGTYEARKCAVHVQLGDGSVETHDWLILRGVFTPQQRNAAIVARLANSEKTEWIHSVLDEEKLSPEVALAFSLPLPSPSTGGRLFTFLPLPVEPGFPCHVQAIYALTDSRQNLRNPSQSSVLAGTREELLISWNYILFTDFISKTWAVSLEELVKSNSALDVWQAWPAPQQLNATGDASYWSTLSAQLLSFVIEMDSPVWPLYSRSSDSNTSYGPLSSLLVAPSGQDELIGALSMAGVKITRPPPFLCELLASTGNGTMMCPRSVYGHLRANPALSTLPKSERDVVLRYLALDPDITLLVDLPIIPLVSSDVGCLHTQTPQTTKYTLLGPQEAVLFSSYDRRAIALDDLPNVVAEKLLADGGSVLNTSRLDSAKVLAYLRAAFGGLLNTASALELSDKDLQWLLQFWDWFARWSLKNDTSDFHNSYLVPSSDGHLMRMIDAIFSYGNGQDTLPQEMVNTLSRCRLTFIHPQFPQAALQLLSQQGSVRSPYSSADLVDHITQVWPTDVQSLRDHLSSIAHSAGRSFSSMRRNRLLALPIFTNLYSHRDGEVYSVRSEVQSIPQGKTLHFVAKPIPHLLPELPDVLFLDISDMGRIVDLINTRFPLHVYSESGIVELAFGSLRSQSRGLQLAFIALVVQYSHLRSFSVLSAIQQTPLVEAGAPGILQLPSKVVDPETALKDLCYQDDPSLPVLNAFNTRMLTALRHLDLLQRQVSREFVEDRIAQIHRMYSSAGLQDVAYSLAVKVLAHLDTASFSCSDLRVPATSKWLPAMLPAGRGLCHMGQCRDRINRALFDRVTHVAEFSAQSRSLRQFLGWDAPVSFDVLERQLGIIIEEADGEAQCRDTMTIIREFGQRIDVLECDVERVASLLQSTHLARWVPVSMTRRVSTLEAVLGPIAAVPGFYQVPFDLASCAGVKRFLSLMGCNERPSNIALLQALHRLKTGSSDETAKQAAVILGMIDFKTWTAQHMTQVMLPDISCNLRCREDVYFDDLGHRAHEFELPNNRTKLHRKISADLSTKLGIQTLSSLNLKKLDEDDDEIVEDVVDRMNSVLRSYSKEQALNEMLANAVDAGASQFNVLLDQRDAKASSDLLSREMSELHSGPSLVIHNDAKFTDEDFKGIRHIGTGGKRDTDNKIGKFGLGAITLFHFTEFVTIISGSTAMFLDPGKLYLPLNGDRRRNALRMPLRILRKTYPGHLAPINGLYGFTVDSDYYDGTLFRLPLRTSEQARQSMLYKDLPHMTSHGVEEMLWLYRETAPESLLFVGISNITTYRRDQRGALAHLWSVAAQREDNNTEGAYTLQLVTLTSECQGKAPHIENWHVASTRSGVDALPSDLHEIVPKHRLKSIKAGIALRSHLTATTSNSLAHRFFSTLPLPAQTCLPAHVNASFALADDRRSIRFDEGGQSTAESRYNRWLLRELIPQVYLYALSIWIGTCDVRNTYTGWPGMTTIPEDPLSRVILEAFYSRHLMQTDRNVCRGATKTLLQPSHGKFRDSEPKEVRTILSLLAPPNLVALPHQIRKRAFGGGVSHVDPEFLRQTVINGEALVSVAYQDGTLSVNDIEGLLRYMHEKSPEQCLGLPLLPLADGSLRVLAPADASPIYAVNWPEEHIAWLLFPRDRFLHHGVHDPELFLDLNSCVLELDSTAVVGFMREHLPQNRERTTAEEQLWITNFWSAFPDLGIDNSAIRSMPLVPTINQHVYISIAQSEDAGVLALPSEVSEGSDRLVATLQTLGAVLLDTGNLSFPLALSMLLSKPALNIVEVLKFLQSLNPSLVAKLSVLPLLSRSELGKWIHRSMDPIIGPMRRDLAKNPDLLEVAYRAPVWPAHCARSTSLRSLFDPNVKILPSQVTTTLATRFLTPRYHYVDGPPLMRQFMELRPESIKPIVFSDLVTLLEFPRSLSSSGLAPFRNLLDMLLRDYAQDLRQRPIKVPNETGTMVDVETLYSRSVAFFSGALGNHREFFIHTELKDYEHRLAVRSQPDFAAFKHCLNVLQGDLRQRSTADLMRRASTLYDWYQELPMQIGSNEALWEQVTQRFIPTNIRRRQYLDTTIDLIPYTGGADDLSNTLVAPKQILRPQHEPIAWTQRALFRTPPQSRLLLADPALGVPSVDEVVEHLFVLASRVAVDYPRHSEVLGDLKATYEWLNDAKRCEEAGKIILLKFGRENLFLNVNDAAREDWQFCSATQLIYGAPDEANRQSVRAFLMNFKPLTLAAGAHQIQGLDKPTITLTSAEQTLARWRSQMNELRMGRQLTDVEFICGDVSEFAHRTVLAVSSEHFRSQFTGGFSQGSASASPANPVQIDLTESETPLVCLRFFLTFVYTGEIPTTQDQDELLWMLHLANLWEVADLHTITQELLVPTITPETYQELRDKAEAYDAPFLISQCDEYERRNAQALRQIEQDEGSEAYEDE